jgi:uncharacterized protein YaaW (UPF0174 family)
MAARLAGAVGKRVDEVSLQDVTRASAMASTTAAKYGVSWLDLRRARQLGTIFERYGGYYQFASYLWVLGRAVAGDVAPAISKLGIRASGQPLLRAAAIWFVGQVLIELYYSGKEGLAPAEVDGSFEEYEPLFDSLNLDQYRELAVFLGVDARVSWDRERLRDEILSVLAGAGTNMVVRLIGRRKSYGELLAIVCGELGVEAAAGAEAEELERKVVQKVLAETLDKLGSIERAKLEEILRAEARDSEFVQTVGGQSLTLGALIAGNLTGFGLYLAASSALSALAGGLGLTLSFSVYTTMSSALSVLFGPVGIAAAAVPLAVTLTAAKPRRAIPAIVYLALVRSQLALARKKAPWFKRLLRWLFKRNVNH